MESGAAISDAEELSWRDGLRTAQQMRALAAELEAHHVGKARSLDVSWEQIGLALGVSRQAAHTKFAGRVLS